MKQAAATLGSGNLRQAVMLPEGEDLNEWVAVNSKLLIFTCQVHLLKQFHKFILIHFQLLTFSNR